MPIVQRWRGKECIVLLRILCLRLRIRRYWQIILDVSEDGDFRQGAVGRKIFWRVGDRFVRPKLGVFFRRSGEPVIRHGEDFFQLRITYAEHGE